MSDPLNRPFTRAEMAAIRRAARGAGADENQVKAGFWTALRRIARNMPFAEDLVATFYCATDPATPRRVRLVLLGALGYFILPVDVIPDIWPVIGFTDDAAVLAAAIASVAGSIRPAHRDKARATLGMEQPENQA
jgi:uncharacterized membrane protein YkvA (DUF1232 family)